MSLRQEHPKLSAHARALQKLCNKHIGTMTTCGVHALNLHNNPSASRTDALVIEVRPLHADEAPGFYCVGDARVESIANFSDVESTAGMLARNVENVTDNEHSPVGDTNDVFFAMVVGPPGLTVVVPLVYTKLVYPCDESFPWRDDLLDAMNKSE
ncbi:hypothetical protein EUX98_g3620 [Antrodiella citrinella]|uniref:Uncharacterized protein n=1 Tax=Antrodiella citrinella TaxID=2447956 RepID=A0A4S4MW24_9APHY|nr:hypothetical protein EUX98_g3620 [Antrodiella citrinella]